MAILILGGELYFLGTPTSLSQALENGEISAARVEAFIREKEASADKRNE